MALALFFLLTAGCGEKIEPGNEKRAEVPTVSAPVAVARITSRPLTYEAVGTVQAVTTSTLASKLMGTIREIRVREGDRVKQGQVLAVIDQRQVAARLSQAQAALDEARRAEAAALSARDAAAAGAQLARATYERYLRLIREDSVSRQEFEEVEARNRQAQASLAQADQLLAAARYRVEQAGAVVAAAGVASDDAAILAPYDGTITAKLSEVGDLASPGSPLLALESAEGYRVDVMLPEAYFEAVRPEQPVTVRIPALGDKPIEGTIQTIVPAADQSSRSFLVKIRLAETVGFRSGMFARVVVTAGEERIMRIPAGAVITQGQLTGIFIVDEDRIARFRLVRTVGRVEDTVEVVTGLDEGQRFVAAPPPTLADGARVEALP